jgi:hypothetical protein
VASGGSGGRPTGRDGRIDHAATAAKESIWRPQERQDGRQLQYGRFDLHNRHQLFHHIAWTRRDSSIMGNTRKSSYTFVVATVVLCLSMLASGSANAGAANTHAADGDRIAASREEIVNVNSGYCLTLLGNATANGSKVYQATCKGVPGQIWVRVVAVSGSRFNIYNPNSGKCLDTGPSRDRAQLYIYDCALPTSETNQIFRILSVGTYDVTINPNWNGDKCVGVAGGSLIGHAPVVFATCNNSLAQTWRLWAV